MKANVGVPLAAAARKSESWFASVWQALAKLVLDINDALGTGEARSGFGVPDIEFSSAEPYIVEFSTRDNISGAPWREVFTQAVKHRSGNLIPGRHSSASETSSAL
jgi:hypothetical protein|tara:strand:- start:342 stop:659 length:318 start_codon:yes stop_codon:yes gene_type:complete